MARKEPLVLGPGKPVVYQAENASVLGAAQQPTCHLQNFGHGRLLKGDCLPSTSPECGVEMAGHFLTESARWRQSNAHANNPCEWCMTEIHGFSKDSSEHDETDPGA